MMENVRAYGAGLAGGQFQLGVFLRKPAVILRIFALVVGLAQWIAVSRGGWYTPENGDKQICLYANSSSTCSFGSAMGFFAVLSSLGLLFLDAKFEKISSIPTRKRAVTTDMILSGLLTMLLFFRSHNIESFFMTTETFISPENIGYVRYDLESLFLEYELFFIDR
ncbi:hypothetical protein WUBG_01527 [Wuchereria bancrofti]|uniref:MARVEL domain-containing protein n=1 Tax=Wuchereria bancrofti TaxID=6293 RepID=J9FDD0_WUCBA|nr:hypothetical protein WUBG_01527 [Wuchereria bancrofti]